MKSDDLISRQAAIDGFYEMASDMDHLCTVSDYVSFLKSLPSAQPERSRGKWNFIGDNMFECTCCGVPYTTQQLNGLRNYDTDPYAPKFCPNCGAYMGGEHDG